MSFYAKKKSYGVTKTVHFGFSLSTVHSREQLNKHLSVLVIKEGT